MVDRRGNGVHGPGGVEVRLLQDLVLAARGENGLDGRVWVLIGEDGGGCGGQGGVGKV